MQANYKKTVSPTASQVHNNLEAMAHQVVFLLRCLMFMTSSGWSAWPAKVVAGLGVALLSERKQHRQVDCADVIQGTFPLWPMESACHSAAVISIQAHTSN